MSEFTPYNRLESISFIGDNKVVVSDILTALNFRKQDVELQRLLVSKFDQFDTHDLDFYLPQLCQILIDRGHQAAHLRRALLELCRRSLRTGILSQFYFSAAVEDNLPGSVAFCSTMTKAIDIASTSGCKSQELAHLMKIYNDCRETVTDQQENTPIERPTLIASKFVDIIDSVIADLCGKKTDPTADAMTPPEPQPEVPLSEIASLSLETGVQLEVPPLSPEEDPITKPKLHIIGSTDPTISSSRAPPRPAISPRSVTPLHPISPRTAATARPAISPRDPTQPHAVETAEVPSAVHLKLLGPTEFEKLDVLSCATLFHTKSSNRRSLELIENIYSSTRHHRPICEYVFNVFCETIQTTDIIPVTHNLRQRMKDIVTSACSASFLEGISKSEDEAKPDMSYIALEESENRLRTSYFRAQFRFVDALTTISTTVREMWFKTKEEKNEALRYSLKKLGANLDWLNGVCIPYLSPIGVFYRVIRIPAELANCLVSRERVPYMMYVEVVSEHFPGSVDPTHKDPAKRSLTLEIHHTDEDNSEDEGKSDQDRSKDLEEKKKMWDALSQNSDVVGSDDELHEDDFTVTEDVQRNDENGTEDKASVRVKVGEELLDDVFGTSWNLRKEKMRKASPYGHLENWDVLSLIVKGGDDLRQEQLAMQIIRGIRDIFEEEGLPLWLNPYMVLATSRDAGLIGTVHDAISIHGLKGYSGFVSLKDFFERAYGKEDEPTFQVARTNFVESLAAYSLVTYILQIKDRHNGNILIDREGHIIHIDYGFMLSSSPGNLAFEKAPFKLPLEMVEVLGGIDSNFFVYFQSLVRAGFVALRNNSKRLLALTQLMINAGGGMTCFKYGPTTLVQLEERFKLGLSDTELDTFCQELVNYSLGNWRSNAYDNFQYYSNGIL
eukprot:TRINITY_DN4905_c0_g1_i1.p1 TRINITY_DN4905_c0_g1~~TRINITY_DN4905_c0_g1_i1.p1  ORF type:complete len:898 (-),score=130.86 TRINITY_DN4905_c0_g1_i1:44-2737(-)